MTRVLYWNIERFSAGKIDVAAPTALLAQQSTDRLGLIEEMVAGPWVGDGIKWQEPPDIFVVVEVSARTDPVIPQGITLFSNSPGGKAVRQLLAAIRAAHGAQWSLVPPLFLGEMGFREGVAVFYDSNNLVFAGPWVWAKPPGQIPPSSLPATEQNVEARQGYGANWAAGFPPDPGGARTWHVEFPGWETDIHESESAGQWQFSNAGNRIFFPGADNRAPFHTRFWDRTGNRWLKLFSVHTSPATATQAVERLALVEELAPAANEVSLIVGDFNVDTFGADIARYNGLLGQGFRLLLDSRHGGAINPNRRPYCMTHLLPTARAKPWNATAGPPDTLHNVYPRFGYMGSPLPNGLLSETGAIDNALARYGPGVAGQSKASVVNPVVGTPYDQVQPAPAGVTAELTSGAAYRSAMANGIPLPGGVASPNDIPGGFSSWNNYGAIRSTSDHLPLFVEV